MKDYSLLTLKKGELLLRNWKKTYLTELNNKAFSLYNYNNFFIPDFLKKDSINDYTDLEYHQWYRVTDADNPDEYPEKFLNAISGYAIISYARNENDYIENKDTGLIRTNPRYYVTVPSAWGGYYDFYILGNYWYFTYDQYAEETMGRTSLKYNINNFASRFFISNVENTMTPITGTRGQSIQAAAIDSEGHQNDVIIDYQEARWTDIYGNPIMGFTFYNNEEIILDTTVSYSRVEKTNIARYTITRINEEVQVSPSDSYTYIAII